MSSHQGHVAEQQALAYLVSQGLQWVSSNYRTRCGEIDLIMREQGTLVFVEVRQRSQALFGGGLVSVNRAKQMKLIRTASLYLQQHKLHDRVVARFDVVSFDGVPPVITWIADAFSA